MGGPFDNHLVDDEKFMQAAAETARELRRRIVELETAALQAAAALEAGGDPATVARGLCLIAKQ